MVGNPELGSRIQPKRLVGFSRTGWSDSPNSAPWVPGAGQSRRSPAAPPCRRLGRRRCSAPVSAQPHPGRGGGVSGAPYPGDVRCSPRPGSQGPGSAVHRGCRTRPHQSPPAVPALVFGGPSRAMVALISGCHSLSEARNCSTNVVAVVFRSDETLERSSSRYPRSSRSLADSTKS